MDTQSTKALREPIAKKEEETSTLISKDLAQSAFDVGIEKAGLPPKGLPRRNGYTTKTWRCCICLKVNKIGKPEWGDRCQRPNSKCEDISGVNHQRCSDCFPKSFEAWTGRSATTRWTWEDYCTQPDSDMDLQDQLEKGCPVKRPSEGSVGRRHSKKLFKKL